MEMLKYSWTLLMFCLVVVCSDRKRYCSYNTCGRTVGPGVLRNLDKKTWNLSTKKLSVEIVPPGACELEELGFEARVCGFKTYPTAQCLRNNVSMLVDRNGCEDGTVEVYVYCQVLVSNHASGSHYHYSRLS